MIFDTLDNIKNYEGLGRVYTALQFLAETDFSKVELGRYELQGDDIFYMVQQYETDPDKTISEAHKKYIDIQFMVDGEEIIGVFVRFEKTVRSFPRLNEETLEMEWYEKKVTDAVYAEKRVIKISDLK